MWGYAYDGNGRVFDTHMARLRVKIDDDPSKPEFIQTARGLGYRMPTRPE